VAVGGSCLGLGSWGDGVRTEEEEGGGPAEATIALVLVVGETWEQHVHLARGFW
jgi:hypothetical protein